jgi:hypothetical protein
MATAPFDARRAVDEILQEDERRKRAPALTPPPKLTGVPSSLAPVLSSAAERHQVPADELALLARQESNFRPDAVNPESGAYGMFQQNPPAHPNFRQVPDPAYQSDYAAARYAENLQRYGGDREKATTAWFGGAGTVDRAIAQGGDQWQLALPPKTQQYNRETNARRGESGATQPETQVSRFRERVFPPGDTGGTLAPPPTAATPPSPPVPEVTPERRQQLAKTVDRIIYEDQGPLGKAADIIGDPIRRGYEHAKQTINVVTKGLGLEGTASAARDIAEQQVKLDELGKPFYREEAEARAQGKGVGGALIEYLRDPRAAIDLSLESLTASLASLIGGAAGGAVTGFAGAGPVGAAIGVGAGTGLGSFAVDYGSEIIGGFGAAGVDLTDPEQIQAAFENPKLMAAVRESALKHGVPVAAFDALSGGLAGKLIRPVNKALGDKMLDAAGNPILDSAGREIFRPNTVSVLAAGLAELTQQATLGGAGEAGGQLAQQGKIYDPTAVAAEIIGELGPGVVETATGVATANLTGRPLPAPPPGPAQRATEAAAAAGGTKPSGVTPPPPPPPGGPAEATRPPEEAISGEGRFGPESQEASAETPPVRPETAAPPPDVRQAPQAEADAQIERERQKATAAADEANQKELAKRYGDGTGPVRINPVNGRYYEETPDVEQSGQQQPAAPTQPAGLAETEVQPAPAVGPDGVSPAIPAAERPDAGQQAAGTEVTPPTVKEKPDERIQTEIPAEGQQPQGRPEGQAPDAGLTEPPGRPADAAAGQLLEQPRQPKVPENVQRVVGARGTAVDTEYEVVDLATLKSAGGGLQPRNRATDPLYAAQIHEIYEKFEPDKLGRSPEADKGPPIVGPDDVIESGNGRRQVLERVYTEAPEKAAAYRAMIEKQGFKTEGFAQPVLIRRRLSAMTTPQRQAWADEANESGMAALTPDERAKMDRKLLTPELLRSYNPDAELASAQNQPFISAFVKAAGADPREFFQDGKLSQQGQARIKGVMLSGAYGGTPASDAIVRDIVTNIDPEIGRQLSDNLTSYAPQFAELKSRVADGQVDPSVARAGEKVAAAVQYINSERADGRNPLANLAQADLLTGAKDPDVTAIVKVMLNEEGNALRGKKVIGDFLRNLTENARGTERLPLSQAIERAVQQAAGTYVPATQGGLFDLPLPPAAGAAPTTETPPPPTGEIPPISPEQPKGLTQPPAPLGDDDLSKLFDEAAGEINAQAQQAATSEQNDLPQPTEAQKEAGNYQKGHVSIQGFDVSIENPAGSTRTGTTKDGSTWNVKMQHHYGYIRRTEGADGEQIDTLLGPAPADENRPVVVIDQGKPDAKVFDETKVMLGFATKDEAIAAYRTMFNPDVADKMVANMVGATEMSAPDFKRWVAEGDHTKAASAGAFAVPGERPGIAPTPDAQDQVVTPGTPTPGVVPQGETPQARWDAMDYGQRQAIAEVAYAGMRKVVHRISGSKWAQLGPGEAETISKAMAPAPPPGGPTPPGETLPDLSNARQADPANKETDVAKSLEAGDRVFVTHEQDEEPTEVRSVADIAGYTADQIYILPKAQAAPAEPAKVTKQATREVERETYRAALTLPAVIEGANSEDFRKIAEAAVEKWLAAEIEKADPARAAGLRAVNLPDKFYEGLQVEAKRVAKQQELDRNRDPAVYEAALRDAMEGSDANTDEQAAALRAGFDHAMSGKTKSTLSGEHMDMRQKGYDAGKNWRETDEGRAWYTGKRRLKLEDTGADLRRWFDKAKKTIDEADKNDATKAWEQIEDAVTLANLLTPDLADGATPGLRTLIDQLRGSVYTFKEHAKRTFFSGYGYRGERKWTDLLTHISDNQSAIARMLKEAAEYVDVIGGLARTMNGSRTVMEAAGKLAEQYEYASTAVYPNGKEENKKRYRELDRLMRGNISSYFPQYYTIKRLAEKENDERAQPKRNTPLIPPKLDRVDRIGVPDHRGGKDITPQQFKETFGFKDLGLGGYVDAQRGQDHLNYSYDAFMDLAQLLGIKPTDISLGGSLYFTIGALGHGNHAAHYSPNQPHPNGGTVPVINVTNTQGDGTVAHEWTHALDYALRESIDSGTQAPAVDRVVQALSTAPVDYDAWWEQRIRAFLGGGTRWTNMGRGKTPRDHAEYALKVSYYKPPASSYYEHAERLDKGRPKPYWSNERELLARAGEAWVFDQLDQQRPEGTTDFTEDTARQAFKDAGISLDKTGMAIKTTWSLHKWGEEAETSQIDPATLTGIPAQAWEAVQRGFKPVPGKRDTYLVNPWVADGKTTQKSGYRGTPYPEGEERKHFADVFGAFYKAIEWTPQGPRIAKDALAKLDPKQQFEAAKERARARFDEIVASWEAEQKAKERAERLEAEDRKRTAEEKQLAREAEARAAAEAQKAADEAARQAAATPPQDPMGPLDENELSNIFDDAASGEREANQENAEPYVGPGEQPSEPEAAAPAEPVAPPPGQPQAPIVEPAPTAAEQKSAAALIAEAAKLGVKGADEALTGLAKLFGGNKLSSFPAFDEKTYEQAKPHFEAALHAFQAAGKSLKEFFALLIRQFGEGIKPYAIRFAKDRNLDVSLGQGASPSMNLAKQVNDQLTSQGQLSMTWLIDRADVAFGGTMGANKYTVKDMYDAMEAGVNLHLRSQRDTFELAPQQAVFDESVERPKLLWDFHWRGLIDAFNQDGEQGLAIRLHNYYGPNHPAGKMGHGPAAMQIAQFIMAHTKTEGGAAASAKIAIEKLAELTSRLPTQTKRTPETDEYQQFSTPPAYAYVVNWLANIKRGETVLEPSAGVGGLAIFAENAGADLVLNELSKRRGDVLRALFPKARTFAEDGAQLHNILPADIAPSVIVMNPPFSATAGRVPGQRDSMNGAKHIEQALGRLAEGGRLVAIVGEGMASNAPAFKEWWAKIKGQYNVRANVGVNGAGYVKYGTTFNNQILVIDKTGPTESDEITGTMLDIAEVPRLLEEVRNERGTTTQPGQISQQGSTESGGEETPDTGESPRSKSVLPPTGTAGGGQAGQPGGTRPAGGSGGQPGQPPGAGQGAGVAGQGGRRPGVAGPRGGVAEGDTGAGGTPDVGRTPEQPGGARVGAAETRVEGDLTESVFDSYRPRITVEGGKPHGAKLVESAAMASVQSPEPTYTPNLPKEIIESGAISLPQIEVVTYAGQAHQELLPNGKRRGFLTGDGTGVGKTRELIGIIMDNWRQGRKKAVVISANNRLFTDFEGQMEAMKFDAPLRQLKGYGKLKFKNGILFTTYDTLKQDRGVSPAGTQADPTDFRSRHAQIMDWLGKDFDGVLIFDEAHKMANAVAETGARGATSTSARADAGLKLDDELPKARIAYASATAATEVRNLGYLTRLGLWGEGTAFAAVNDFIAQIGTAGVAAMEYVARDMKALGMYLARTISYDGVKFQQFTHALDPGQKEVYNEAAKAWETVRTELLGALEITGQADVKGMKGRTKSMFYSTQQRFFNMLMMALQMPTVLEKMEADVKAGYAVVMQLVNTNEAGQDRKANLVETDDFGVVPDEADLEYGPMDMLIEYITTKFPTAQFQQVGEDEKGKPIMGPVLDSEGAAVHSAEAIKIRDKLLETLNQIKNSTAIPGNPLDLVIEAFGTDVVGEGTGRSRRFIKEREGDSYRMIEQKRGNKAARADLAAFQDDKKQIFIFSDAMGTGASFHASLEVKNQRLRRHYIVQPGWKADSVMQALGRTHRTYQKQPPEYVLFTTDVKAQKRFISSIARRLDQLGALVMGERKTTSQGLFNADDNLESEYANQAQARFWNDLFDPNVGIEDLNFALLALRMDLNLIDASTGSFNIRAMPSMPRFLNRLLGLDLDTQNKVFDGFYSRLEEIIQKEKESGTYDLGLETLRAISTKVVHEEVVYTDQRTNATTRYVKLEQIKATSLNAWEDVKERADAVRGNLAGFFRDNQNGHIFMLVNRGRSVHAKTNAAYTRGERWNVVGSGSRYADNYDGIVKGGDILYQEIEGPVYDRDTQPTPPGNIPGYYIRAAVKTFNEEGEAAMRHQLNTEFPETGYQSEHRAEAQVLADHIVANATTGVHKRRGTRYTQIASIPDSVDAEKAWNEAYDKAPRTEPSTVHMITGVVLPIWDRFGDVRTRSARVQTDDGERLLGRILKESELAKTLKKLGINKAAKLSPNEIMRYVHGEGRVATLANGWVLRRAMVSGEQRLEIKKVIGGDFTPGEAKLLTDMGAFRERIQWDTRTFIPTGDDTVLARILADKPVADMSGEALASRNIVGREELPKREGPIETADDLFAIGGVGTVPNNENVDYLGYETTMTPDEFLALAPKADIREQTKAALRKIAEDGGKFGIPFIEPVWNEETNQWEVGPSSHEGRHRVQVARDLLGKDAQIPVHILPRQGLRARHITPEMKAAPMVYMGRGELASRAPVDQTETPAFRQWFGNSKVVDAEGKPLVVYHGTNASFDVFQPHSIRPVHRLNGKEIKEANSWDMGDDRAGMPEGFHYGALSDAATLGAAKALKYRTAEAERGGHIGKPDTDRTLRDLRRLQGGDLTWAAESRPSGKGSWFTPDMEYSFISRRNTGSDPDANIMPVYLSIKNPIYLNASAIESAGFDFKVKEYKEQGYDGAVFADDPKNWRKTGWSGATQIVAFDPEQIKSAIGNRGTFDPNSPNIVEQRTSFADVLENLRDVPPAPGGMSRSAVREAIADLIKPVENLIDLEVVQIPYHKAPNTLGLHWLGTNRVMLIADKIPDVERARETILHEVYGHLAIERYADMATQVDRVLRLRPVGAAGPSAAKIAEIWRDVEVRYADESLEIQAREVIAIMAETGVDHSIINHIIAAFREILRDLGIKIEMSDADLRAQIAAAARELNREGERADRLISDAAAQGFAVRQGAGTDRIMASRARPATPATPEQAQAATVAEVKRGGPIERLVRLPFRMLGLLNDRGDFALGAAASKKLEHYISTATFGTDGPFAWMNVLLEAARMGMLDRYGVPQSVIDQGRKALSRYRALQREGLDFAKQIMERANTLEEAQILQDMLEGQTIDDERFGDLPQAIRAAIDKLSLAAVDLNLISRESYERNRGTYVHRVYAPHERGAADGTLAKWMQDKVSGRRHRIQGNELKGRGIFWDVTQDRLLRDMDPTDTNLPGRGVRKEKGGPDTSFLGRKFRVVDVTRKAGEGQPEFPGMEKLEQRERVVKRVYWPLETPLPAQYADAVDRGTFEVRRIDGGKFVLWRDFTPTERQQMGQILDARYTVAKTFHMLANDIANGQYFRDLARNPEATWQGTGQPPPETIAPARESRYGVGALVGYEWVKVPTTAISETGGKKKWGDLAGKYVRAAVWKDLQEYDRMNKPGPWQKILDQWKLNKTARNPVVHMNNLISNLGLADLIDVRWTDVLEGLHEYVNKGEIYRQAEEHGAYGHGYIDAEMHRHLKGILAEISAASRAGELKGFAGKLQFYDKFANIVSRATGKLGKADDAMVRAYGGVDDIFRTAAFIKGLREGLPPDEAAAIARDEFLNYDVRAPWINGMRRSFLPFLAYTYRAAPVIADAIMRKPWKIAKYALLAELANVLAYAISGGDEDDERKHLMEQDRGHTWMGGAPYMMRLPWNDEHGRAMFLDIRRWIPAGDVFDQSQSSVLPIPAWMQVGGPLVLGAEMVLNRAAFTGQDIVNPQTDDLGDKAAKWTEHGWRSWMPSAPWIYDSWYYDKVAKSLGGRDTLGRPYSTTQAVAASVGIKARSVDPRLNAKYQTDEYKRTVSALKKQLRDAQRQRGRGLIDDDHLEEVREDTTEKLRALGEERAELTKD